jgi:hypothetical protein
MMKRFGNICGTFEMVPLGTQSIAKVDIGLIPVNINTVNTLFLPISLRRGDEKSG